MTTPKDPAERIVRLRRNAELQNARYPQYKGHWDGPEWKLFLVTQDIRTKMGLAFLAGEVTLAKVMFLDGRAVVSAYSTLNGVDTILSPSKGRWL